MSLQLIVTNLTDVDPHAEAATAAFVGRNVLGEAIALYGVMTQDESETMSYALRAYCHLLSRDERISLSDYADRISATYAVSVARNAQVVHTLRRCEAYPLARCFGLYTVDFDCDETGTSISVFRVRAADADSAEYVARGCLNPRYTWRCTAVDRARDAA
ncbi:hypothetical protein WT27_12770 [Burkholderia territorii]|uniref:Uncharacterized protein n=1 Tax=Burkholderia territorii TaxID=1503055 RepID=A0A105V3Z7_9BURK|nr:hypothetical protein [Burkholderia territorii]KVV40799.1 hypothetical protein WT27_12770 [Burkholderia territorii]KVX33746.1 hypothetical protein WT31_08670 [Burkholderia territorii]